MKYKVGDKVRAIVSDPRVANTIVTITDAEKVMDIQYYVAQDTNGEKWGFSEDELEPAYADGGYVPYHKIPTPSKPVPIEEQLVKDTFKDCLDSAFEVWRYSNGLYGFKVNDYERVTGQPITIQIDKAEAFNEVLNGFVEMVSKEDKPMKFTFSTKEGYRIDKSNNSKIETITTHVQGAILSGEATCDKVDYDERQGVLEALANAVCNGNFDKAYKNAAKINKREDKVKRTCDYCGKVFDTVEECKAHEAWHVERKKARRERYLLRKRAKEIAFEEQAQKMAKEMVEK